jgi:hypothetical protein
MLKLKAQDADDLAIISAQMQDALVKASDMRYGKSRQFALIANRFAWDALPDKQRRRAGLHFEHVTRARKQGFGSTGPDAILSLLSISFKETAEPSGEVTLTFSAGHTIILDVEYLDCALADQGAAWSSSNQPNHD